MQLMKELGFFWGGRGGGGGEEKIVIVTKEAHSKCSH